MNVKYSTKKVKEKEYEGVIKYVSLQRMSVGLSLIQQELPLQ